MKEYERLYPHAPLEARKQVITDLKQRVAAAQALARHPDVSSEEKDKALAFSKVYEDALNRLPPPEALPKKVPGPHTFKLRGKGGRLGKSSPADLQKREELTRLLMTPSMEEMKPPPTLKLKKWKRRPERHEHFTGREHLLIGSWPLDNEKQIAQFRKEFQKYKRQRFEVNAAQWDGKAYLYVRATKKSGLTGEFVKGTYPSKMSMKKTRKFQISDRKRGTFKLVGFFDRLPDVHEEQNRQKKRGFQVRAVPFRKGIVKGKTELGFALYARHTREPERKPVMGGGETGRISPRQWREVRMKYRSRIGIERGDRMVRYVDGKETVLNIDLDLTPSFPKASKRYDRLRTDGYPAMLKNYISPNGVMYYVVFKGEKKYKKLADEYRQLKKQKRTAKMVPAPPRWPKEERPKYVQPSKPHRNALLVMAVGATDAEGQREIIRREKTLKKKGIDTEVVFGTDATHLYAVPSKGQKTVVLPKPKTKKRRKKAAEPIARYKMTPEAWAKMERSIELKRLGSIAKRGAEVAQLGKRREARRAKRAKRKKKRRRKKK